MAEWIIACPPATRVRFFQTCTLTFGRPAPECLFYSSICGRQQRRDAGRARTPEKQQIGVLLRWQGWSLVTLVFSHPVINLHLNLSQTSCRLNLTTFSSKRALCACACVRVCVCAPWPGFTVIPREHCRERKGRHVHLQSIIPPVTNNRSVSWPFNYQEKKLQANTI